MPFVLGGSRRGGRILGLALGLTLAAAGTAQAGGAPPPPPPGPTTVPTSSCTPEPTLTQPFATWSDLGTYTPAPGGDMETGAQGWTLTRSAAVVKGNEPFFVGGAGHASSLDLPEGSSATSPPLCIDETYPFYRLFARNTGEAKATLKMEVVFLDAKGNPVSSSPTNYTNQSGDWAPTGQAAINVFTAKTVDTALPVSFRFTAMGKGAHWQIDDVYVDPWARR